MNSSYLLDFFTLQSISPHDKKYMVRIMDSKESPKKHVSYIDYVNKTETASQAKIKYGNRYFVLMQRESETSSIETKNKRSFGDKYNNSLPISSPDNKLMCLPRFSNAINQVD